MGRRVVLVSCVLAVTLADLGARAQTSRPVDMLVATHERTWTSDDGYPITGLGMGGSDAVVCAAVRDEVFAWQAAGLRTLYRLRGHQRSVDHIECSPDGRYCVSASQDGAVFVWDLSEGRQRGHTTVDAVSAISITADGSAFATVDANSLIQIWDVKTCREIRRLNLNEHLRVSHLSFLPDGKRVVFLATNDILKARRAMICEVASGVVREAIDLWQIPAVGLRPTPDGKSILVWGGNSNDVLQGITVTPGIPTGCFLWLFDISTRREIQRYRGHTDIVLNARVARDGRTILSAGGHDGTMRLWDTATGAQLCIIQTGGEVWDAVYAPDAEHVVSGGRNAQLWQIRKP